MSADKQNVYNYGETDSEIHSNVTTLFKMGIEVCVSLCAQCKGKRGGCAREERAKS